MKLHHAKPERRTDLIAKRVGADLIQEEVAIALGVSAASVSLFENGLRDLPGELTEADYLAALIGEGVGAA